MAVAETRRRSWGRVATFVGARADTRWVLRALGTANWLRASFEEVMGAAWHFAALPSADDLHEIGRQTMGLRRRVADLERKVAALELCEGLSRGRVAASKGDGRSRIRARTDDT